MNVIFIENYHYKLNVAGTIKKNIAPHFKNVINRAGYNFFFINERNPIIYLNKIIMLSEQ